MGRIYHGKTAVIIPAYDTEGMKQYYRLTIEGTIGDKKLVRGIKQFIAENFKQDVTTEWVRACCQIVNEYDIQPETAQAISDEVKRFRMDTLVHNIQRVVDEIDRETDSGSEAETVGETEQQMSDLSNQSETIH